MADPNKTEKATPRRVEKAREKGQYASSRHLVAGIQFLLATTLITAYFGDWCLLIAQTMGITIRRAAAGELNASQLIHLTREALVRTIWPLALAGLGIAVVVLACQLIVTRFGISFKKLAPDLNRLNPWQKLKGMASENVSGFVRSLLLIIILPYLVYHLAWGNLDMFVALPRTSVSDAAVWVGNLIENLLWKATAVFLVLGFLDFAKERHSYEKSLRMSKQDLRDEVKESEGNQETKARIKRLIRSFGRKRMLQDVRTATAVIVNPTHYAVALRYDNSAGHAPVVVAKGKNHLALRIRAEAGEHAVPIVENPPLAQSLYAAVEIGQEIPVHLYRAVAEVLAHVYKLMNSYYPSGARS